MSGLSDLGFEIKRLEDIQTDLQQSFERQFGPIDLQPDAVGGQVVDIISKELTDIWELMELLYNSSYPDTASGVSLDNVVALNSITRQKATKSTGIVQLTGIEATQIPANRILSVQDTKERFFTDTDIVLDRAQSVELLVSVLIVANSTTYSVIINGTSIDYTSDSDATEGEIIAGLVSAIDGSAEPVDATDLGGTRLVVKTTDYSVVFTSDISVNLQIDGIANNVGVTSKNFGEILAIANTLTVIETPIAGWASANNQNDIDLGNEIETDTELRQRRSKSLQITGTSTVEAIRSRLLQVPDVTSATVTENDTNVVDGDGRPPHSFEAVVSGGTDDDVANEIWLVKPAGIETHGNTTVSITDSQNISHDINFSRATDVYLHVRVTLTKSTEIPYPADGDTQMINNIVALGETYEIDNDVIVQQFFGPVYAVPGVTNAVIEIATSALPTDPPGAYQTTNLAIGVNQLAVFDSTRVIIQ